MCQRSPGPRCASHARVAMNKALKTLETEMANPVATQTSIRKVKKAYDEAVGIYDSTPTGQKKITDEIAVLESKKFHKQQENNANKAEIRAAKTRLNRAIILRASHIDALAKLEAKEANIRRIDAAVAEGEQANDFTYRYQRDVGNVLASRGGVVSNSHGWEENIQIMIPRNILKNVGRSLPKVSLRQVALIAMTHSQKELLSG